MGRPSRLKLNSALTQCILVGDLHNKISDNSDADTEHYAVLVYLRWTEKMWVGCGGNVGGNQHISHIITIYCQHPTHKTPIPTIYQLINNFSATFSPKIINVSTNNLHFPHFKINILSTHPHSAHN